MPFKLTKEEVDLNVFLESPLMKLTTGSIYGFENIIKIIKIIKKKNLNKKKLSERFNSYLYIKSLNLIKYQLNSPANCIYSQYIVAFSIRKRLLYKEMKSKDKKLEYQ